MASRRAKKDALKAERRARERAAARAAGCELRAFDNEGAEHVEGTVACWAASG